MPNLARTIVFNVAWMNKYQGDLETIDRSRFAWLRENEGAGEQHNFSNLGGQLYGYTPHRYQNRINIERIGAGLGDESVSDITVVFKARDPETGHSCIVGLYRNATVFRERQTIPTQARRRYSSREFYEYRATCKAGDGLLLPPEQRRILIHKGETGEGFPRQTAIFYPQPRTTVGNRLSEILGELERLSSRRGSTGRSKPKSLGRQPDPALRIAVERAAVKAVREKYLANGFQVNSVESDNIGYDLEASRPDGLTVCIEVKGLSGRSINAELTPNEYKTLKKRRVPGKGPYRLCIVTDALRSPRIHDFRYVGQRIWLDVENGNQLTIEERVAARVSV